MIAAVAAADLGDVVLELDVQASADGTAVLMQKFDVKQFLELSQKHAAEAYELAEVHETNPRSIWGYVQGLTRLSQRTPWQDGRFALDRAASRLLTTVH